MSAQILDGRVLAKKLRVQLKDELDFLKKETGQIPRMINVMVGQDHGACAYANSQKRVAEHIGLTYELLILPKDIAQNDFVDKIHQLNGDKSVHGIMIHKPVPEHIDYREAANELDTSKDLEGINVTNIGRMLLGDTQILPCTPAAVMELIAFSGADVRGKEVVVVGASEIVGKPLCLLLLRQYATVSVCHIATSEAGRLADHLARAEILIVAVGKAHLIKGESIREGAVVVDVGINDLDGQIVGDVEYDSAVQKASWITPVPGGVGPVTVTILMRNAIEAFKQQNQINSNTSLT